MAIVHISNDEITGNSKKGSDFWARIGEYFCNTPGFSRSTDILKSHWHMVAKPVQKFSGVYNRIKAQKRSGWSDEMITSLAVEEYIVECKTRFQYDHVWNIVKGNPKWHEPVPFQPKRTKTSVAGDYSTSASDGHSTPVNLDDDTPISFDDFNLVDEPNEYQGPTRPIGQKKAKAKAMAKETTKNSEVFDGWIKKKSESVDIFKGQMDHFLFNQDINILMMDRSHMDEKTLATHMKICEAIRQKHNL